MTWFDNKEAEVYRSFGTIDVYYGGSPCPDGPGHGHIKATDNYMGEKIVYWRLPDDEGGRVIVEKSWSDSSDEDLRDHMTGYY